MKSFKEFQELCLSILAQSDNCIESQKAFRDAQNITEMTFAWKRFWAGIIREVPTQVMQAFDELYLDFKMDLNRAGIFYNEYEIVLRRGEVMLVGNETHPISVYGHGKVYVIGVADVTAHDDVTVYNSNLQAKVTACDNAHALMSGGSCVARDGASVTGKCDVVTYDRTTVHITDGTVDDHGHATIDAYGDVVITTFTHKGIKLSDGAKILFRE